MSSTGHTKDFVGKPGSFTARVFRQVDGVQPLSVRERDEIELGCRVARTLAAPPQTHQLKGSK
jgi:hypothetical protein